MRRGRIARRSAAIIFAAAAAFAACADAAERAPPASPARTLSSFRSNDDLTHFLRRTGAEARAKRRSAYTFGRKPPYFIPDTGGPPPADQTTVVTAERIPPGPIVAFTLGDGGSEPQGSASPDTQDSDDGPHHVGDDPVLAMRGDILVVLYRGRLSTVSIANGALTLIDSAVVDPSGFNPDGPRDDRIFVSADRVVLTGSHYAGSVDVIRFHLEAGGRLAFEDAHQFRSRAYGWNSDPAFDVATGKLILPFEDNAFEWGDADQLYRAPAVRKWTGDPNAHFRRLVDARNFYLQPLALEGPLWSLHSLVTCDVTVPDMPCRMTSLVGGEGKDHYLSASALYVWTHPRRVDLCGMAPVLYRIPRDGSAPTAIVVAGRPHGIRPFFEEGGAIHVVVARSSNCPGFEYEAGQPSHALLRIPLTEFGDGLSEARAEWYRPLLAHPPKWGEDLRAWFANGFLYYTIRGSDPGNSELNAMALTGGAAVRLRVPHSVDFVDTMGDAAFVPGRKGGSVFVSVIGVSGTGNPETVKSYKVAGPGANAVTSLFLRSVYDRRWTVADLAAHDGGRAHAACVKWCDVDWLNSRDMMFSPDRIFAMERNQLVAVTFGADTPRELARVPIAAGPSIDNTTIQSPEERGSGWRYDESSGCRVHIPDSWSPVEGLAWWGRCENGIASGDGTLVATTDTWGASALTVRGEFRNGQLSHGEISDTLGEVQTGRFTDGLLDGAGSIAFTEGTTLKGAFSKGVLVRGSREWIRGVRYEGSLRNGVFDGHGSIAWRSGARFAGRFENGLEEGPAKYLQADGSVIELNFHQGLIVGPVVLHQKNGSVVRGNIAPSLPHPKYPPHSPAFPELGLRLGDEGTVVVKFLVTTSGWIEGAHVVYARGRSEFADAALGAIGSMRLPATINGIPVAIPMTRAFVFKLTQPHAQ